MSRIESVDVVDLRVPTSDTLLGSDPFHKKPNYSTVLTALSTEDGLVGTSVNFLLPVPETIGSPTGLGIWRN